MTNILRLPANTQARLTVMRDSAQDKFDVIDFTYDYINEEAVSFPAAWAYWKLDETSGTRADSSGNGRDGTPSETGTIGYEPAKLGNGATFDRFAYLTIPTWPSLVGDVHVLYSFWFKVASGGTGSYGLILDSDIQIYTIMDGGGVYHLDVYTYTYSRMASSGSLNMDTLYFATVYYDGNGIYIEINNSPSGSDSGSTELEDDTHLMYLGNFGGTPYTGNTTLDEFGVWVGANADEAIERRAELYNSGAGWSPY